LQGIPYCNRVWRSSPPARTARSSRRSRGNAGFDLYSFAVSDVYQDLFGEGSYVGKGIYDVAAFERSLEGQVRQNTLLSHDPFRRDLWPCSVGHRHRPIPRNIQRVTGVRPPEPMVRGDWQLIPWLFPIVRTEKGMALNRLSIINIWKIFDNLRRSLLPPTLLALLVSRLAIPGPGPPGLDSAGAATIWPAIAVKTDQDIRGNLGARHCLKNCSNRSDYL